LGPCSVHRRSWHLVKTYIRQCYKNPFGNKWFRVWKFKSAKRRFYYGWQCNPVGLSSAANWSDERYWWRDIWWQF
jgi:hypothetical protein